MDERIFKQLLLFLEKFYTIRIINKDGCFLNNFYKGLPIPWSRASNFFNEEEKNTINDFIAHAQYKNQPIIYQDGRVWKVNAKNFKELKERMTNEYNRLYVY